MEIELVLIYYDLSCTPSLTARCTLVLYIYPYEDQINNTTQYPSILQFSHLRTTFASYLPRAASPMCRTATRSRLPQAGETGDRGGAAPPVASSRRRGGGTAHGEMRWPRLERRPPSILFLKWVDFRTHDARAQPCSHPVSCPSVVYCSNLSCQN